MGYRHHLHVQRYTALVLTQKSKDRLQQRFGDLMNPGWRYIGDHMTICMGTLADPDLRCVQF